MDIIYPSEFHDASIPDAHYQEEVKIASKYHDIHFLNSQALYPKKEAWSASEILKFPRAVDLTSMLYRGWMLSDLQYKAFESCLLDKNYQFVTNTERYSLCHYLHNWYPHVGEYTPLSSWWLHTDIESIKKHLENLGEQPLIIKDSVASQKHRWKEACFIPLAKQGMPIVQNFIKYQTDEWDQINGFIVFRNFEQLKIIGEHPKSKLPLALEWRTFIFKNEVVSIQPRWTEVDYPTGEKPPSLLIEKISSKIDSPFFTIDLAQKENKEWICIEIGDGQVSDFQDLNDLEKFYKDKLKQ